MSDDDDHTTRDEEYTTHGWDCAQCRDVWREVAGRRPGLCMICSGVHWPWEPHLDEAGQPLS